MPLDNGPNKPAKASSIEGNIEPTRGRGNEADLLFDIETDKLVLVSNGNFFVGFSA
jgi:hypothetical protein